MSVYRDATFSLSARKGLKTAGEILEGLAWKEGREHPDSDYLARILEGLAAIDDVCERWDANAATELVLP
jgi:hypothetical protein